MTTPVLYPSSTCNLARIAGIIAMLLAAASSFAQQPTANPVTEISVAEKRLFEDDHMKSVALNTTLSYTYAKSGSLETAARDKITVVTKKAADGKRDVTVQCLSGDRKLDLPLEGDVKGNPILLCFLERDIKEMKRLTGGSLNYYRKRIRLALAESAKVAATQIKLDDKTIAATEIAISPYADDPARSRYTKFANKSYRFVLSEAVPGGIVELSSVMHEEGKPSSVMIEERISYQK